MRLSKTPPLILKTNNIKKPSILKKTNIKNKPLQKNSSLGTTVWSLGPQVQHQATVVKEPMGVILTAIFQQNPSLNSLVIFLPPCISSWILADMKVAISPLKVYSSSLQLRVGFLQNLCFARLLKMLKIVLEWFTHSNI